MDSSDSPNFPDVLGYDDLPRRHCSSIRVDRSSTSGWFVGLMGPALRLLAIRLAAVAASTFEILISRLVIQHEID